MFILKGALASYLDHLEHGVEEIDRLGLNYRDEGIREFEGVRDFDGLRRLENYENLEGLRGFGGIKEIDEIREPFNLGGPIVREEIRTSGRLIGRPHERIIDETILRRPQEVVVDETVIRTPAIPIRTRVENQYLKEKDEIFMHKPNQIAYQPPPTNVRIHHPKLVINPEPVIYTRKGDQLHRKISHKHFKRPVYVTPQRTKIIQAEEKPVLLQRPSCGCRHNHHLRPHLDVLEQERIYKNGHVEEIDREIVE